MKTSVLLSLWLLLPLSALAQTPSATTQERLLPCRPCCNAPHEPGLLLILAPELAEQCPSCTLLAVAQCPITDSDFAAQQTVLRYTLRDPEGVTSTFFAPMTKTPNGWNLQLYPPLAPAPPCDPGAL